MPTRITSPDDPALAELCAILAERAIEMHRSGGWPAAQLRLCGEYGVYDWFTITLPADVVKAMTAVQMEAKAGELVGTVTMEADFASGLVSGEPTIDENKYFGFSFLGAKDNGDGTYTLTFQVQNNTQYGLSHATIGLPDGAVPSTPTNGSYDSKVCTP
jgi:hypothetical protein